MRVIRDSYIETLLGKVILRRIRSLSLAAVLPVLRRRGASISIMVKSEIIFVSL
jgi:hypothetical protein